MKVTLLNPSDFDSPEHWVAWVAKLSHGKQETAGEDPVGFCQKLIKMGHLSVFEHATFRVHVPEERSELLDWLYENPTIPFIWGRDGMVLGVNLRHCLEPTGHQTRLRAFALGSVRHTAPGLLGEVAVPTIFRVAPGHTPPREDECFVGFDQTRIDKVMFVSFLVEEVSRVTETQFVRHRSLSFLVQSGRHVKPLPTVLPHTIREKPAVNMYEKAVGYAYQTYEELRGQGIPKECARFVLPQGAGTRMVVTGSIYHWRKFLKERLHPAAMWEIRRVAQQIQAHLGL